MSRWLADGMGGPHPENTIIHGDVIPKGDCSYCNLSYEHKNLRPATKENVPASLQSIHGIKGKICRKCRGLGTWDQENDICNTIKTVKVGDYSSTEEDYRDFTPQSKWWNENHEDIHNFGNLIAELEGKMNDLSLDIPIGGKAIDILSEKGFDKLSNNYAINPQSKVPEIISAAKQLVNELEKEELKRYKSVRKKWGKKIAKARKSSDFQFLTQFIQGRTTEENYPFAEMENLGVWTEKNPSELEGLPEDFANYLENFGKSQDKEFLMLADSLPTDFRNDYFRILLCNYPEDLESSKFIPKTSEIDSVMNNLKSVDVELIVPKIPQLSWGYELQVRFLEKLFSQDMISQNTLFDTIADLSIGNLHGDRLLSYLVRNRLFSVGLISNIVDQNVRIMTSLSLDAEEFSKETTHEDFLILVNSLFYSLIISRNQLKTYLQSDSSGESEQIIRNIVEDITDQSGIVEKSISNKFRSVLGLAPIHNDKYLSLESFSVIRWDKNNQMELCVEENKIRRKKNLAEKEWKKEHRKILTNIDSQNPYWIARAITEWDYSFTEEVRTKLDSMLSEFSM